MTSAARAEKTMAASKISARLQASCVRVAKGAATAGGKSSVVLPSVKRLRKNSCSKKICAGISSPKMIGCSKGEEVRL